MIRLKLVERFTPGLLKTNKAYSFINFASIGSLFHRTEGSNVTYFCDGMLLSAFMSKITGRPVERVSFDFTSIADPVLRLAEQQGRRVYFVGARQVELDLFLHKIRVRYPHLQIAGFHDGYFDTAQAQRIHADIRDSAADILITGLGAGLQEQFVEDALSQGFGGVAFTCGGFIRQEATATHNYYPDIINRLHLRAFYRMYREPHTIKRYLIDYPGNFLHLWAMIARHKVAIDLLPPDCREARMKILFILKDFTPGGGVESVQQRLAEQFLKEGHQVGFFVMNGDTPEQEGATLFQGGGKGFKGLLKSILQLRRIIDREGITHLIAAKEQANLCTWFATFNSPCRVIYARHAALDCAEQKTGPISLRLLYALYLCGNGKVVAVSDGLRQGLADLMPWGRQRIRYCPNAVITEYMLNAAQAPLPDGLPSSYWLGMGRLVQPKGFHLLLDAYALALSGAQPLPDLVIAGDGPERAALTAQAQHLGIADRVHFTGFLSNPYPLIRHARLLILSSFHEGLPTVLIEALALGTPTLACDSGSGPRELLDHGRLGRLVKVNDVAALAEGMLHSLMADGQDAPAGRVAAEAVRQYSSHQAAEAYYQVWNQ
ncbi:WecB/TagA/CpsF family glycosyltransferase [Pseudomonas izuensis]|uniref:WecB/TagA/CpsF family glycosyltransferase n=1 Tax=Pseudomonas izuensis TaxID=2684212 RepID=UPI001FE6AD83|nr:WecB/TagA/CpsF family glycosyltransferase [Pseudomonas izuensis]